MEATAGSVSLRTDRIFYTGMAAAIVVTVFAGFAPTYFLKGLYGSRALPPLVHVHGVLFTAWTLFLLGQTSLVAAHRTDLHRKTGLVGIVLALAMLPVGSLTAVRAAASGLAPAGVDPFVFLIVPLGALVVFTLLLVAALLARGTPETHKRLMLLATVSLITPAIARLPFVGQQPAIALGLTNLFVVAGILYDFATRRRLHPAYLWGGLLILLSGPLRFMIGRTDAWKTFAQWLVQ